MERNDVVIREGGSLPPAYSLRLPAPPSAGAAMAAKAAYITPATPPFNNISFRERLK
ncbi:MAG: hypothetical protein LBP81_01915 [Treponema sp.]|jgi:hypothetical protein|nr:hypothetical protein [Treponema sp.]